MTFISIILLISFSTVLMNFSLKILSDFVTCIGIYHSKDDETFFKKNIRIFKYYFFLSLPFFIAIFIFVKQVLAITDLDKLAFISTSTTIIILLNARFLANPTKHFRPIDCKFYYNKTQPKNKTDSNTQIINEILKIKERMVSFFYAFVAISVFSLFISAFYQQIYLGDNIQLNFTNEQGWLIIDYFVALGLITLLGEYILQFLDPMVQIKKNKIIVKIK